jgi:hypothetical protein
MLGMPNGHEYFPFDIESPHEGLLRLTDWVHKLDSATRAAAYEAQLTRARAQAEAQAALAQLHAQAQRDAALLLLVFVGAVAAVALLARSQ